MKLHWSKPIIIHQLMGKGNFQTCLRLKLLPPTVGNVVAFPFLSCS